MSNTPETSHLRPFLLAIAISLAIACLTLALTGLPR